MDKDQTLEKPQPQKSSFSKVTGPWALEYRPEGQESAALLQGSEKKTVPGSLKGGQQPGLPICLCGSLYFAFLSYICFGLFWTLRCWDNCPRVKDAQLKIHQSFQAAPWPKGHHHHHWDAHQNNNVTSTSRMKETRFSQAIWKPPSIQETIPIARQESYSSNLESIKHFKLPKLKFTWKKMFSNGKTVSYSTNTYYVHPNQSIWNKMSAKPRKWKPIPGKPTIPVSHSWTKHKNKQQKWWWMENVTFYHVYNQYCYLPKYNRTYTC